MANSVEDALNRASADQRDRAMATIDEARRSLQSAQVQMGFNPSGDAAAEIARQEQIIEEAKRTIPTETMQSVDTVSPPLNMPPMHDQFERNRVERPF